MAIHLRDNGFEFEKELEIDVEADFEFEGEVKEKVDVQKDIDVWVDQHVDLTGNTAQLYFDVQAVKTGLSGDTMVDSKVAMLVVEDQMSSISLWAFAAAE